MSGKQKLYVAGVGMVTSVGANAEMTAASVRAGISQYQYSIYYNKDMEPMKMALVPDEALPPLDDELKSTIGIKQRQQRLLRLATPALQEAITMSGLTLKEPLPIFLAAPEPVADCPPPINKSFIDLLQIQTGIKFNKPHSAVFSTGRAGGMHAIDMAFKYFEATGNDIALIGGVDSYKDPYILGTLDMDDRVLSENIMDGFVPGEAAGFMLLVSNRMAASLRRPIMAKISPPGLSNETGHRYSKEAYTGTGLADAIRIAIENGTGQPIRKIYSSLNGEIFGAKEYGVAIMRNSNAFDENVLLEHPADRFGDIGAAFAPVMIGLMCFEKEETCVIYCSSDGEYRGAACVA